MEHIISEYEHNSMYCKYPGYDNYNEIIKFSWRYFWEGLYDNKYLWNILDTL